MVFICSLSDFFHVGIDECRAQLWAIMRRTPHLIYRVLTKRPERIKAHLPPDWGNGYPNVWLGVTVEAKQWLHRMDTLRDVKAVLRWASVEPLLEDLSEEINLKGFGWIAVGGESGGRKGAKEHLWDPKADWKKGLLPIIGEDGKVNLDGSGLRTMKYEWAENLRKKVKATKGCLFMMKQVTAPRSGFGPNALDGVEWNELPAPPNGLQWLPFKPHKPSSTMTPEQIAGFKAGLTSPFKPPVEKRTKL
jgi:protein gp37